MAGFSSNEGHEDALFAELFGVYHGLMLVINTDSLEVLNLLQHPDHFHMHVYASLLLKIFRVKGAYF
jgi:hypothetical protein